MSYADFGRYLSQQRELRGLSLTEVADATKISESMLVALENGQVDRLPGRVFVLNYVRAYAQVIGMAPEDAVLRYEEVDRTLRATPPPAALERQRKRRALLILLLVLLATAGAGYGAVVLLEWPPAAAAGR